MRIVHFIKKLCAVIKNPAARAVLSKRNNNLYFVLILSYYL